jgi:hypothetical protein
MSPAAEKCSSLNLAEPPVIAWLTAHDFVRARKHCGFSIWTDRREFSDERDALFLGYGYAGVTAFRQLVPFGAFERWTRLTGASCDVMGLDEFAAHWRWRSAHPAASIVGRFRATSEEACNISAQGARSVRIRAEVFQQWSKDFVRLGLFAEPNLDDYATHAISCCVTSRI